MKDEVEWTKEEQALAESNGKSLNSIMGSLHEYVFPLIAGFIEAKKSWEILQTRFEGIPYGKQSNMHLGNSQFQFLKMQEDEMNNQFYTIIQELTKTTSTLLGEPFFFFF